MKPERSNRQSGAQRAGAFLGQLSERLDRCMPGLRTAFLAAGVLAAAARTGQSADFLFATGLLFQFAIWFEQWWATDGTTKRL